MASMRMTNSTVYTIAHGFLLCLATSGCIGDDTGEPGTELLGMEFLLQSAVGFDPVEGTTVSLRFQEGEQGGLEFALNAGCNHLNGGFTMNDGILTTTYLMMTEMGCAPDLMAQDDWLIGFMSSGPTAVLDGDRLALSGAEAILMFLNRELADPDRELAGPTWTIDTFIEGEGASGAASSVNMSDDPTVVFGKDGSVQIYTGCTNGVGNYTTAGNTITLGSVGYDDVVCSDASLNQVDAHVQQVLSEGTLSYEINATRLTLQHDNMGLSAYTE